MQSALSEGFTPHTRKSPLTDPWEPIYAKALEGRLVLGLFLRPEHTNSRGLAHGGMIAALADNAMGISLGTVIRAKGFDTPKGLVTVNL